MTARSALRLVPSTSPTLAECSVAWGDIALVGFLFLAHALTVFAYAAGWSPDEGTTGYATAVALVCGRELLRELRPHVSSWVARVVSGAHA
jgi:hypothetical protein